MEQFLSVVEDVFEISGRGCVIFPGIPLESSLKVKVRDAIRLARPDGTSISSYVAGIELINVSPPKLLPIPILLPSNIQNSDVPIGTEVLITDVRI